MISLRMPEPLKRPVSCFQRCAPQEFIGRSLRLKGAVIDQEALVGVLGAQVEVMYDHHDPSVSLRFEPGPDAPHETRTLDADPALRRARRAQATERLERSRRLAPRGDTLHRSTWRRAARSGR